MAVPRLGDPDSAGPWRSGKELGFNLTEFSVVLKTPSARTQGLEKQGLTLSGTIQFPHSGLLHGEAPGRTEKRCVGACTCVSMEEITLNVSIIPWSVSMECLKGKRTKSAAQMSSLPLCTGCHGGLGLSEAVR